MSYLSLIVMPLLLSTIAIIKYNTRPQCADSDIRLLVAILSARHHFDERQSLRETWVNTSRVWPPLCAVSVTVKFVVGLHDCHIPPQYRHDQYSCQSNHIDLNQLNESELYSHHFDSHQHISVSNNYFHNNQVFRGFSFVVSHAIVVTKLAIPQPFLITGRNVSLVLLNALNKDIIASINISLNSPHFNQIYYERIKSILLPKNFYGLLMIDNEKIALNSDANNLLYRWRNESGILRVLRIYYGFSDFESFNYNPDLLTGPSIAYTISDRNDLQIYNNLQNESQVLWNQQIKVINDKLLVESKEFDDIIFIDLIDTYRNLSLKLLKSFQHAVMFGGYTHFLKTDDDCYLNINNLLLEICEIANLKHLWWGNFRRLWSLQYYGKWAETDYGSPFYPPFACGSGHILSMDLVEWLSKNMNYLHNFQGEDVSLGIWLSAINPNYKQDIRWLCNTTEYKFTNSFTIPQLTPINIKELHEFIKNKI